MSRRTLFRVFSLSLTLIIGVLLLAISQSPSSETVANQQARLALGPSGVQVGDPVSAELDPDFGTIVRGNPVKPAAVNLRDIPSRANETDPMLEAYLAGEIDLAESDGPLDEAVIASLKKESARQGVDRSVQNYDTTQASIQALTAGTNFKAIDYTQSQQGVPPDPDITVGTDHIIVGVNTSFAVYDKSGNTLVAPTLFSDFWGSNCGTGSGVSMFDPYLDYDEKENRYVLGITAFDPNINNGNNGYACIAVSQADDATGQWWLYSFDGNPGGGADYFFDYPHLGVGQDALYLGANMFTNSFVRNHIFAFDKFAMYNGTSANSTKLNVGSSNFTLQPAKMHGFNNGGWPTNANEPHYFVDAQFGNNQNQLTVWQFNDPFGSASITVAGTVNVNSYSLPINQQQLNGNDLQGNDNRLLDVKYWGGKLWTTHTIGCNPGGGTVNCVRWYEIDISSGSPSLVQQGTFGSSGIGRSFPAIAPNACGDMLVGYTQSSPSIFPSVYVAGREAGDPPGQLKDETLLHAGEAVYTSFDSVPYRWGDYTGMAIDPDGTTFWYVGEYSRQQATSRWSTWVGAFSFPGCTPGPTPTPGPTNTPPPPPTATNTPAPGSCTTFSSNDTPIALPNGTSSIASTINVGLSGTIADVNVSVDMPHAWVGDLIFDVSNGSSTVRIIDQPGAPASTFGCSGDDILATLDDGAASAIENQCAGSVPTINGTFSPNNGLSAFNGQAAAGSWTLTVIDTYTQADAGSLDGWSVEICTDGGTTPTETPPPPPTNTPTPLPTATNTPPPPPTPTPDPGGSEVIYVSSTTSGNAGGISFRDEDIMAFDTATGTWSYHFDGSDVGHTIDVDAFVLLDDGTILLSSNVSGFSVPGFGTADDSDILRFIPTSLGSNTSGTFEIYFDGSDVGLTSNGEDVDAIEILDDGRLLLSTAGAFSVPGVSGRDEDLTLFTPTSLGTSTSGTWERYFDGSDVGLTTSTEDTWGAWLADNGDIYLTSSNAFSVPGLSGDGADIFICTPITLGSSTSCTFALYWDGSANGYAGERMDGMFIGQ